KSFGDKSLIRDFSYVFKKQDRIGLSGRNGSGKSTFLNLITGQLNPDQGKIIVGETTVFGYYKQGGLEFKEEDKVIDVVKEVADFITLSKGEVITASQLLTNFLFPPQKQHGPVSKLSGGERKRLQLMRVLMKNPNVLILDEPTNDLDIDTLNVLEEFLENYSGILILVSHDRYLIDKLTGQLFIFEGNGQVRIYNGNYADYKQELETKKQNQKLEKAQVEQIEVSNKDVIKRKPSYKEQKEFESLCHEVELLEASLGELTALLNQCTDHVELSRLATEIKEKQ